jgi:hypothetical protein
MIEKNKKMLAVYLTIGVVVSLLVVGWFGYIGSEQNTKQENEQYLFIERKHNIHGVLIRGNVSHLCIDGPAYYYDKSNSSIEVEVGTFVVNNSLVMIYGDHESVGGDIGSGIGSRLLGVYHLPLWVNQTSRLPNFSSYFPPYILTVKEISNNGNVQLIYNDTELILSPGDNWTFSIEWVEMSEENEIRFNMTTIITNHGFIDKSKIKGVGVGKVIIETGQEQESKTTPTSTRWEMFYSIIIIAFVIIAISVWYRCHKTKKQ